MLKVVAMTFGDLAVDGLFDPSDLVHDFVAFLLHQRDCKSVLRIDNPYKKESICLQTLEGYVHDLLIVKSIVCNCYTASRVC